MSFRLRKFKVWLHWVPLYLKCLKVPKRGVVFELECYLFNIYDLVRQYVSIKYPSISAPWNFKRFVNVSWFTVSRSNFHSNRISVILLTFMNTLIILTIDYSFKEMVDILLIWELICLCHFTISYV